MPKRATTNPVLQMNTKSAGMARTNTDCDAAASFAGVEGDMHRLSPIQTENLFASTTTRGEALRFASQPRPAAGPHRAFEEQR
jgi:hypothetical protein